MIVKDFRGNFISVGEAITDKLTPNAYSYDGQIERLQSQIEKLQEVLSALIECTYGESAVRLNKRDKLSNILGYGYEVEE